MTAGCPFAPRAHPAPPRAHTLPPPQARARPWYELLRSGVSTDAATPRCAWAMLATAGLYLVVQARGPFVVLFSRGLCMFWQDCYRSLPAPPLPRRAAGRQVPARFTPSTPSPTHTTPPPPPQIPALFIHHPKRAPYVSLVGCILCFISLGVYCGYQARGVCVCVRAGVRVCCARALRVFALFLACRRLG